jgi:hypothetical protein
MRSTASAGSSFRRRARIFARLTASLAGFEGAFIEAHMLDARHAKKVPKQMIGRALSKREANTVHDRLARDQKRLAV